MALLDNIYDKDKGIQWPGLIGGLLGGLFVFNKLGGMQGGMLGMIGAAIAVLTGAWLANKGTEMIGGLIKKTGLFGKGGPSPEQTPGKVAQQPKQAPGAENYKPKEIGDVAPTIVNGSLIQPAPHVDHETNPNAGLPKQPVGTQKTQAKE